MRIIWSIAPFESDISLPFPYGKEETSPQGTGLTEHHSQHDSSIVATVALVITGERAHSCRGSTGIIDSPNVCIGQEPVLACAKLTGVVEEGLRAGLAEREHLPLAAARFGPLMIPPDKTISQSTTHSTRMRLMAVGPGLWMLRTRPFPPYPMRS